MDSREQQVRALYQQLLDAWNNQDARGMADLYIEDGEQIGFDGSQVIGQAEIYAHIAPIFEHHATARFVSKVKSVRFLSPDIAVLRAIAGMVPRGQSDINPNVNTHHTLIATWTGGEWRIVLFQNTPAQFHGRPELVEQMSAELRELL
ncbi:SgcJ/EcaC family oxidoreductase [Alicyclobacillus acidoterrestris]|uniref:SgcJ/EcaC family oxidoreductase n=1 Tax=Alicyclobacillus acidoterrestris (strain ATCC 49025 / DSM 3922 / CIP 106132 / NCIMB 13137 / GD3B) TaxID=1356854 RepID=T0CYX6_ALIAG|nr:SgcJ/EcaC family oxidoreductase [Alicyclobacillus acidoterrestris]EPZ44487.1 methionyl-tRNA formyltransferase [Alicyclobacillus acidoterrestris ATCC 49025]UNO49342.1 SgcJ/EcaC family oxidoreductase [Alicyclobacillus acidoterrestris]